jgi:3-oxoadipate enol-lactonase
MKEAMIIPACLVILASSACAPSAKPPAPAPAAVGLANGAFSATLNGFDIHYEVHGQGPVVMVVSNSWGLSLAGLRELFRPLEEKLTLVYFDPRGMGGSAAIAEEADMGMAAVRSDFQALREHLGLRKANAIGWSNGAMNLILIAAERPETIEHAVFVHGAASFTEEDMAAMAGKYPELMGRWAAFQNEVSGNPELTVEEKTARMRELWLGDYFPTMTGDPAAAGPLMERLFGAAEFSFAHADYANRESPSFDARDELASITARSLVIAGAHDMMPPEKVKELADGIAGAEYAVFERSGHFAPAEETERFTEVVWGFLGVE